MVARAQAAGVEDMTRREASFQPDNPGVRPAPTTQEAEPDAVIRHEQMLSCCAEEANALPPGPGSQAAASHFSLANRSNATGRRAARPFAS
jgi:hypothetical protein